MAAAGEQPVRQHRPRALAELARIAERATFDSLFLADGPAVRGNPQYRPASALEPTILLTALAAATSRIGLIATASTTYNDPYNLARRFASLDHVSGGRAGWNIVTTADTASAQNFGLDDRPDHRERYARAAEFVDVSIRLWDSWEDGADLADKAAGIYADPARIHEVDYEGQLLPGPRPAERAPLAAGPSAAGAGRVVAGRPGVRGPLRGGDLHRAADPGRRPGVLRRHEAAGPAAGRDPDQVKILPGIVPVIGSTEAEAHALSDELEELITPAYGLAQLSKVLEVPPALLDLDRPLPAEVFGRPLVEGAQSRAQLITDLARRENLTVRQLIGRLGGGRGHRTFTGTPEQVADTIQDWFDQGAADGFNVMPAALPAGLQAFADHVIPIFRRRGLFRTEYTGQTLREHYGLPRPDSQFAATRPRGVPEPVA